MYYCQGWSMATDAIVNSGKVGFDGIGLKM
jgi:hypothetical protein